MGLSVVKNDNYSPTVNLAYFSGKTVNVLQFLHEKIGNGQYLIMRQIAEPPLGHLRTDIVSTAFPLNSLMEPL